MYYVLYEVAQTSTMTGFRSQLLSAAINSFYVDAGHAFLKEMVELGLY